MRLQDKKALAEYISQQQQQKRISQNRKEPQAVAK